MSNDVLQKFLDSRDARESDQLLERLVWEQSAPIVERIVAFKVRGAIGEDVRSEVLTDLIARLRELKCAGDRETIRDFKSYTAVSAYHGCDKYYRRSYPQRYRLENRLRYLLGSHRRLALWVAHDGDWVCGNQAWRPEGCAALSIRVRRADSTWASSREAARLIEAILDPCHSPMPFEQLGWNRWPSIGGSRTSRSRAGRITRKPPPASRRKSTGASASNSYGRKSSGLPLLQRASLLLNMRDEEGGAALPTRCCRSPGSPLWIRSQRRWRFRPMSWPASGEPSSAR